MTMCDMYAVMHDVIVDMYRMCAVACNIHNRAIYQEAVCEEQCQAYYRCFEKPSSTTSTSSTAAAAVHTVGLHTPNTHQQSLTAVKAIVVTGALVLAVCLLAIAITYWIKHMNNTYKCHISMCVPHCMLKRCASKYTSSKHQNHQPGYRWRQQVRLKESRFNFYQKFTRKKPLNSNIRTQSKACSLATVESASTQPDTTVKTLELERMLDLHHTSDSLQQSAMFEIEREVYSSWEGNTPRIAHLSLVDSMEDLTNHSIASNSLIYTTSSSSDSSIPQIRQWPTAISEDLTKKFETISCLQRAYVTHQGTMFIQYFGRSVTEGRRVIEQRTGLSDDDYLMILVQQSTVKNHLLPCDITVVYESTVTWDEGFNSTGTWYNGTMEQPTEQPDSVTYLMQVFKSMDIRVPHKCY